MASIVIWGRARDMFAGELPPGVQASEVGSLAELQAKLDATSGTLVLVDPELLDNQAAGLEAWIKAGGNLQALFVGVVDGGTEAADEVLQRFAFLDDMVLRPLTPGRLRLRLDRALDTIHNRRVIAQLEKALARKSTELHELNKIGVALSAERDINKLLDLILAKCREITAADAGSLYLVVRGKDHDSSVDDHLSFELTQNDTLAIPFEKSAMSLAPTSIAGYVGLTGETVNVSDVYHLPAGAPYAGSGGSARSFDEKSGYRTKSMLVVAMKDHMDEVIGVVQLINKKRDARTVLRPLALVAEAVIPFTSVDEELVSSLASQAAVAYENTRLIADIRKLFESFVSASVTAIESRDPTTSGHSGRVAILTCGLAERVDASELQPFRSIRFTRDQIQEIRYASLLHDFGKVGVREKVLIKGKKLYVGEMMLIKQRIAYIKRSLEAEHVRTKLDQVVAGTATPELLAQIDRDYAARLDEVEQIMKMILHSNEPSILEEESFRALMDLPSKTYGDIEGNPQPFLTPNELQALCIRRGSLSEKERREIESHVTHTYKFLAEIAWTGEFRRVPEIAYAHHEKLDGTGYPRRLAAADIPVQSRMMTIADIFDALVAWDRPYKKSVPVQRALDILGDEAAHGKIDSDLLRLFIEARVFERTLPRAGAEAEVAPR
jgi:HD-GYP domain-containing protein (c-di-GMP phosphodiesterase class II)